MIQHQQQVLQSSHQMAYGRLQWNVGMVTGHMLFVKLAVHVECLHSEDTVEVSYN